MEHENVFTEKYRPRTLDTVIGQQKIVQCLKGFVSNKDMPNLIFVGRASTGKTTCALALAKEMYGEHRKQNFYELNASDEGKVEIMRTKIKKFAESSSVGFKFKIVFFDEADYLSNPAQAALRRTIEKTSHICRFIFSCNFPHKIIEPIAERCSEFRFARLKTEDVKTYINQIAKKEELTISESATNLLSERAGGSMRRPLNLLQTLKLAGISPINNQEIMDFTYWLTEEDLLPLMQGAIDKSFVTIDKELKFLLYDKGFSTKDIISNIGTTIKNSSIPVTAKLQAIEFLATIDFRISVGANPIVQLRALFANIMKMI